MKWMKKLRLINWHYFVDETLEFGKQTLITGKNAAGKSTIIDAMQVLFVADQRQIRFNAAAHDEAKRSMINYLRGKIGNDERTFLRDGDFTSYIAAEFRDDEKKESFVVGVVIDVFRDQSYEEEYFILADRRLAEVEFLKSSGQLRNREEFRRFYGGGMRSRVIFERNKANYQKALLARMGQVHERFFSVFTKALSFKPIQDIRAFVYDYILDKKELQLDLMKQNFEIHERYRQELEELQKRKESLHAIRERFNQYARLRETVKEQDYVIRRLKFVLEQEIQEQLQKDLDHYQQKLQQMEADIELALHKVDEAKQQMQAAYQRWQNHQVERQKKELEERIAQLTIEQEQLRRTLALFAKRLRQELQLLDSLSQWPGNELWQWEARERENLERLRETLAYALAQIEQEQIVQAEADVRQAFQEAGALLAALYQRTLIAASRAADQLQETETKIAELEEIIRDLENQKRTYPPSVHKLKSLLEQRLGDRSKVWIFCEEMEVRDESWRDAIEGYLNTQRYDLLVEPHVFAEALAVYEREKWTWKLEGVGLVDTEKERKYLGTAERNSLAEELTANHPVIRAHLEHLLGKVIKAENEQELRKYRTAVTRTCMVYHNLVARQIPKRQYEVPFIGAKAIVRQLEIRRRELTELKSQRDRLLATNRELTDWTSRLAEKQSQYASLSEHLALPTELDTRRRELETAREQLETLLQSDDFNEVERLKAAYEEWRKAEQDWANRYVRLEKEKTKLETEQMQKDTQLFIQRRKVREAEEHWQQWREEHGPEAEQRALVRWEDATRQNLPTAKKIENWENNWKGNQTRRDQEFLDLQKLRQQFNFVYSFNGPVAGEDNEVYEKLLHDIEHLDIPEYQKKVETALKESEEEFKSHFVFKLREAIQMARREFDELNYALRNFPFSEDRYHFEVTASEKYKKFYDAVMDPLLLERGSLFEMPDDERVAVLHELFELLVRGEAGDLEEFTDYRRYLDFDIIVTTRDSRYRFSQVLREKSGGETQTPFYIAILASFHHLYRSGKTMRLVVFDEAFNKMDEQRIQSSLRLIKQMNLQLIAAVPDEKMQHMAPEVTTTLIVNRHEYQCFVDLIDRWEDGEQEAATAGGQAEESPDLQQQTLF
ncbi:ATP-binding protein [Effusibacillus pohliae]|uniref:ATP-binding protein n=1 Tax=Effusibacillus pohliae TaxID=232270 RepID=UPI000366382D|nr:SbcC/MukB-like Walker B domain-containing protein [Effusibacillus pohliae]